MTSLPDPRECLRLYLREQTGVIQQKAGTRIGVALSSSEPAVRISSAGGPTGHDWAEPLLLVECWGKANVPDDGTAGDLARAVADSVDRMRGEYAGGWVAGAGVESGPADSPDPRTARPRQQLTVRLQTAPLT